MSPTMIVLAGANGSGKSTLYATRIASSLRAPFINADNIQRDELRDPSPGASYEAARIAAERRQDLLIRGEDLPHRSRIAPKCSTTKLALNGGTKIWLRLLLTEDSLASWVFLDLGTVMLSP